MTAMADEIRIRARLVDAVVDVRVLMLHPMETGLRKDAEGAVVPAHYISDVQVRHGERTVLQARMTIAVSRDPLLSFRFRGGQAGDTVSLTWTDNLGRRASQSTLIV